MPNNTDGKGGTSDRLNRDCCMYSEVLERLNWILRQLKFQRACWMMETIHWIRKSERNGVYKKRHIQHIKSLLVKSYVPLK